MNFFIGTGTLLYRYHNILAVTFNICGVLKIIMDHHFIFINSTIYHTTSHNKDTTSQSLYYIKMNYSKILLLLLSVLAIAFAQEETAIATSTTETGIVPAASTLNEYGSGKKFLENSLRIFKTLQFSSFYFIFIISEFNL